VRLVVDSADLPLNVSREVAQKSPEIAAIGKAITSKLLQELTKICENDSEKFATIWENFGAVIKEGLHEDPSRRDALFALALFASTKSDKKNRSLKDYVADLKENQTAIYYITGEDAKRLAASPQIEGYRARGIEVLLLDDSVDAFWVTSALGFEGKPFKSVTQGLSDIDAIPQIEKSETETVTPPDVDALVKALKATLGESIEDVRVSTRLTESAACLIASDQGLDRQLAKILSEHGQLGIMGKPILEINPTHAAIQTLGSLLREKGQEAAQDRMHLLVDLARVADGELPQEPAAFTKRLAKLMAQSS
jgi:molecular chaperone HtpG